MDEKTQIVGYHGTSKSVTNIILTEGFKSSEDDSHWLGDGVYMFVDGIGDVVQNAKDWAIFRSWDNLRKRYMFSHYGIIKSVIEVRDEHFLDLTSNHGIEVFNYIVYKCSDKLSNVSRNLKYIDGYVINFARNELGLRIDVVKANEYIKLKAFERKYNINSRIPNCTICSVANQATIKSIELFTQGRLKS